MERIMNDFVLERMKQRRRSMSVITSKRLQLVSVLACLLVTACGDDSTGPGNGGNNDFVASEPFDFQFDVTNQARLRADAVNATFNITGAEDLNTVSITGEKSVASFSMEDAEDHLQFVTVEATDRGNEILIVTDQPGNSEGRDYNVEFEIRIPVYFDVNLLTGNGATYVDSLDGDVSLNVANGQVILYETGGDASVNVANGTFDGRLELPSNGALDVAVLNGPIVLAIPQSTSAEFSAVVLNGSIGITDLTLTDEVVTETSVTGTLGSGDGMIVLDVVNGTISVDGY
jgi:hypothetical protein